jgi:hypothetical protein
MGFGVATLVGSCTARALQFLIRYIEGREVGRIVPIP